MPPLSKARTPRQARGQERLNALLDAAAALAAEGGLEAVTTNAVAARAGAHIGSLYHFFPNKEALLTALGARYLDELRTLWDEIFSGDAMTSAPADALIDAMIERFAAFEMAHTGFNALFYGSAAPDAAQVTSSAIGAELVERITAALARRCPHQPSDRLAAAAAVMLGAVKTILPNTLSGSGDSLRAELKAMLAAYLRTLEEK